MGTRLYVGNLSYTATTRAIEELFGKHGEVRRAEVVMDRDTGQSKGFAFVEMSTDQGAKAAISALDGTEMEGRNLKVNEARPREERGGGGGGRPRSGGRY